MIVYVIEPGAIVNKSGNKVQITLDNKIIQEVPIKLIETLVITGKVVVTNGVMEALLNDNINFIWVGYNGKFVGRLENVKSYNILRQYKQFKLYEQGDKKLEIAKKIILGKTKNQKTILMRYNKNLKNNDIEIVINKISYMIKKIDRVESVSELMGVEGYIAKLYFKGVGSIVPKEFEFTKRTKFPPKDAVNSVLSFGYSLLFNDLCSIIISKRLNPYIPVLHSLQNGHQALCSDLMEEWRPIIVDSLVINMFKNNEFHIDDFTKNDYGVFITPFAMRKFIRKYENKMASYHKFLDGSAMDYRTSIEHQVNLFLSILDGDSCEKNINLS
ncbi:MAG: CRISPR-associated endonuclease Cas1 [Lachnospirales bacterium]